MSLGKQDLIAATVTDVYQCTTGKTAVVNISVCNRSASTALIRIALSATTTPANSEYLEYNTSIPSGQTLERTAVVVQSTEHILAHTSIAGVNVIVHGFED